jgi:hypothetical protein
MRVENARLGVETIMRRDLTARSVDAWIECGCRYAEMVIYIRDKIGNEQISAFRCGKSILGALVATRLSTALTDEAALSRNFVS